MVKCRPNMPHIDIDWVLVGKTGTLLLGSLVTAGGIVWKFSKFFGEKFADFFMKKKMADYEKEISRELENLRAANQRVNHILVSLHDEEMNMFKRIANAHNDVVSNLIDFNAKMRNFGYDTTYEQVEEARQKTGGVIKSFSSLILNEAFLFIDHAILLEIQAFNEVCSLHFVAYPQFENGCYPPYDYEKIHGIGRHSGDLLFKMREHVELKRKGIKAPL